jgi:hypothetical protein
MVWMVCRVDNESRESFTEAVLRLRNDKEFFYKFSEELGQYRYLPFTARQRRRYVKDNDICALRRNMPRCCVRKADDVENGDELKIGLESQL